MQSSVQESGCRCCAAAVMTAQGQTRSFGDVGSMSGLPHLVGEREQIVGYSQAEHPGGLSVDDQLEPRRLYDWHVRGLRALEDVAGIDAHLMPRIRLAGSVTH